MKVIAILDPSVGTENVGDEIIYDSVRREVDQIFGEPLVIRISTHEFMNWESRRLLAKADHVIVGGSNLLKSKMEWNLQWKLSPLDLLHRHRAILLGCGWKHDENAPTFYTRTLYRRVLAPNAIHSLRDGSAQAQLQRAGFARAANTACVTMWTLDEPHCAAIPANKADEAVVTLTAYHPDLEADRALLDAAFRHYSRVSLFVQQPEDLDYARSLAPGSFAEVAASLKAYDRILERDVDFIGTRLHGGMRALQKKRRTLIVEIDNRARDIAKDTRIPAIGRGEVVARINALITQPRPTRIALPTAAIADWRGQFAD